jgi:YaiO family outer membrane protein
MLFFLLPAAAARGETGPALYEGTFPEALPRKPSYEIQGRSYFENYSFSDEDTTGTALYVLSRGPRGLSLFSEAVYQRKFGREEALLSAGAIYKLNESIFLEQTFGFSEDGGTFPDFYSLTGISRAFGRSALRASYRLAVFDEVNAHTLSAGGTFYALDFLYLDASLFHTFADFKKAGLSDGVTSFLLKSGFHFGKNEIALLYGRNSDAYLSADRIGRFESDTYAVVLKGALKGRWRLLGAFSYERRRGESRGDQRRYEGGLSYSW